MRLRNSWHYSFEAKLVKIHTRSTLAGHYALHERSRLEIHDSQFCVIQEMFTIIQVIVQC